MNSWSIFTGTCTGLYSPEEFSQMALQMLPSHVTTRRLDKLEQAFDKYVRKVMQNLHIVVAVDSSGEWKKKESWGQTLWSA